MNISETDKQELEGIVKGWLYRKRLLVKSQTVRVEVTIVNHPPVEVSFMKPDMDGLMSIDIYKFGLSARVANALNNAGIGTVGDIFKYSADSIIKFRNMGIKGFHELREKLQEAGFLLGPSWKLGFCWDRNWQPDRLTD